tara:strand:- start:657 stop:1886 length:1230 start_codon:yes stop_codon:yes gene_type:complete
MATIQIADNDARVQYTQAVTANSTTLTIDFPFFSLDDIEVIVTTAAGVDTTLTRGSGTGTFAVNGTAVDDGFSGGNITLGDSYDNTHTYTIFRDITIQRTTDFPTSGPFNVASLNTELDKLTAITQQNNNNFGRAIKLTDSDATASLTIPSATARPNKYLGFDGSGNLAALSGTGATIGTIDTANIADDAIEQSKIANNAVGADQIAANSVSASEINVTGNGTSGQYLSADGDGSFTFATLPTAFVSGMLMPYAGASAPSGWLLCYGQAISRSTYADLFTALGTTYGVGDGSSTFNLPDLRGRVVAGQDDMGGSSANRLTDAVTGGLNGDTLGDTGGTESHTLTTAQLPAHSHGTVVTGVTPSFKTNTGDGGASVVQSISVSSGATSTGSDSAHNNVQPTIILNYIIKE